MVFWELKELVPIVSYAEPQKQRTNKRGAFLTEQIVKYGQGVRTAVEYMSRCQHTTSGKL